MIDRKRLITIIAIAVAAVLVIAGIVTAAVIVGSNISSEIPDTNTSAEGTTGQSGEEEQEADYVEPVATFTQEQSDIVRNTAQAAATWSRETDPSVMVARYEEAGMSKSLASSFTPMWSEAFDSDTTAEMKAPKVGVPQVNEYLHGQEDGTGIFVVSVVITYEGYAHKDGKTTAIGPGEATWQFALDERTSTVTQVVQPPLSEIEGLQ